MGQYHFRSLWAVMIVQAQQEDFDKMIDIWLRASYIAHDFISSDFWDGQVPQMKNEYLPIGNNYVYIEDTTILGFVSVVDTDNIAALFVDPIHQRKGIGTKLLEHVKSSHTRLTLSVFKENQPSFNFYCKNGFKPIGESEPEEFNGHVSIEMEWKK